jgi:ABC transport system ATP-binding/permease protein
MPIVRLDKVSLAYGLRPLLDQVDLQIRRGERLCLLGRNGEGKSSLLKLIAGSVAADSGQVWVRPGARVAHLDQEITASDDQLVSAVVSAGLVRNPQGLESWEASQRVERVMSDLGLDAAARIGELSGGWQRRVMLGRALVIDPDLLLLDEPTNHLDIEGIAWLEEFVLGFAGAVLFVSHDRSFVRRVAGRILELDRGALTSWPGDYDAYVAGKQDALQVEARHAALFDKKLRQEEAWIRQGVEARRTRNEGRVRALKQLRRDRAARRDRTGQVQATVQDAAGSGKLVIEAVQVSKDFGGAAVVKNFTARIMRGDRVGIIGPNGCGKSTLIKLLTGALPPGSGEVRLGTNLAIAYFDQQREQLDPSRSIADNVTGGSGDTVMLNGAPRHIASYLRDFLFSSERLQAPVSMLSGGERNRLLLARLFARPMNLLIMDEPTNDLDVDTLDMLEEMIGEFQGTLLLVSHDRTFLDNVVTSTLVFEGGGVINEYVGGYADWLQQRRAPAAAERGRAALEPPVAPAAPAASPARAHRLSYKDARELAALPAQIQALEEQLAQLQARSNDAQFYRQAPERVAEELRRLTELTGAVEAAYARWQELESA